MRKCIYFILMIGYVMSMNAQNETLYFDVVHNEKAIGSLKTEKIIKGNSINYLSNTSLEFHVFTKIAIEYNYGVTYVNDHLDKATVKITVHGHVKTDVMTKRDGSKYGYYSENEKERDISKEITYSAEKLLFEEPVGVLKVYAEEHGVFHDLKKVKEHVYLKTTPEGHKSTYYYKNGKLQKSEIDAGIISFSIVLKN